MEPQKVVTLDYAQPRRQTSKRVWWLTQTSLYGAILSLALTLAIIVAIQDAGPSVITGVILVAFGVALIICGSKLQRRSIFYIGFAHCMLVAAVFTLTTAMHWQPREACVPFLVIDAGYMVVIAWLSVRASRQLWTDRNFS